MTDPLATYPPALRDAIRQQRAELKARQLAGQQTVGPWAPAARVVPVKAKRPRATVTPMRRRA